MLAAINPVIPILPEWAIFIFLIVKIWADSASQVVPSLGRALASQPTGGCAAGAQWLADVGTKPIRQTRVKNMAAQLDDFADNIQALFDFLKLKRVL